LVQVGDGEPALLIFNEQTLLQRGPKAATKARMIAQLSTSSAVL